jgi:hypothetical protein
MGYALKVRKANVNEEAEGDDQKLLNNTHAVKYKAGEGEKGDCYFSKQIACSFGKSAVCPTCPHFNRWKKQYNNEKRARIRRLMQEEGKVPWATSIRPSISSPEENPSAFLFRKPNARKLI